MTPTVDPGSDAVFPIPERERSRTAEAAGDRELRHRIVRQAGERDGSAGEGDLDEPGGSRSRGAGLAPAPDPGPVLVDVLEAAILAAGASAGFVNRRDPENGMTWPAASRGFNGPAMSALEAVPATDAVAGSAPLGGVVVVEDLGADPACAASRDILRRVGLSAILRAPIVGRSGRDLGALTLCFRASGSPAERAVAVGKMAAARIADVLENARLAAEVERAAHGRDQLLAVLAHELRNPLAPMRNAIEILRLLPADSPRRRDAIDVIDRQVARITELVQELVDASAIARPPGDVRRGEANHPFAPSPSPHGGTRRRILVVDDNRDAADSLGQMLRLRYDEVQVVYDGETALTAASRRLPEVVLLDLGMPRMNGYDVARRMRGLPGGEDLLIVATTGWAQTADRQRSRDAGFDHHLVKPVEPLELFALLRPRAAR